MVWRMGEKMRGKRGGEKEKRRGEEERRGGDDAESIRFIRNAAGGGGYISAMYLYARHDPFSTFSRVLRAAATHSIRTVLALTNIRK
eukprot:308176-Rhodomonas_salina.2